MTEENKPAEQPSEALGLVEQAKIQADRIEAGNKEYKELVKRNEEAAARQMLGGGTGGHIPAEVPKEETAKEYAQKILGNKK